MGDKTPTLARMRSQVKTHSVLDDDESNILDDMLTSGELQGIDGHSRGGHDAEHDHDHGQDDAAASGVTAQAILIALTIHSFLEGLGLGSQHSINSAEAVFVAILIHKSIAAFVLGLRLGAVSFPRKRRWLFWQYFP